MRQAAIWTLLLTMSRLGAPAAETQRLQVAGEWCFIKTPSQDPRPGEAVILMHGNGETVEADSSSWERAQGQTALMDTLLNAGFVLAQSNHGGVPGNGMWGNTTTQRSVLALMEYLRDARNVETFHAVAISAGNVTLLNLLLDGQASFESAVLIAPVTSLESLYRCPAGVNRVAGLAEAFGFEPAHGCPGDPEGDRAFRRATADDDPLRKARGSTPRQLAQAFSATRFMALFDREDPKVPPSENLQPFVELLDSADIDVILHSQKKETHSPTDLLLDRREEIAGFLDGPVERK